ELPGPALGIDRALELLEHELDPLALELGDVEVVLPVDARDVGVGARGFAHGQDEAGRLSRDPQRGGPLQRHRETQDAQDQLDERAGQLAEALPRPLVEFAEAVRVGLEVRRLAVVPLEGAPVLAGPGRRAVDLRLADLLGEPALGQDGDGEPVPSLGRVRPDAVAVHPAEGAALDELDVVDDEETVRPGDLFEEPGIRQIVGLVAREYHGTPVFPFPGLLSSIAHISAFRFDIPPRPPIMSPCPIVASSSPEAPASWGPISAKLCWRAATRSSAWTTS